MENKLSVDYALRMKEYNKVNNPKELLDFMDKYITYGLYGTDNKVYTDWKCNTNCDFQIACQNKYALCDKERILKYGIGTCWDQLELERFWFKEHNYKFKTFFIWFYFKEQKNDYVTHTYLVYEKNNKYYYFEHADINNKGIYEFNSYEEAIVYQMKKHIDFMKKCNLKIDDEIINHIQIIEFEIPRYGLNQHEYYENLFKSKIVYEQGKFIN